MTIYSILPDVEHYKHLHYGDEQLEQRINDLTFDGSSKTDDWKPPFAMWIEGPSKGQVFDIPDIAFISGDLALSPKATYILSDLIKEEAELLPMNVENEEWTILNIINIQDAIKESVKARSSNNWTETIVFDENRITNGRLFKDIGKPTRFFTDDEYRSFKHLIESNDLRGVYFVAY